MAAPIAIVANSTIDSSTAVQNGVGPNFQDITAPGFGAAIQADQLTLTHVTVTNSSGANALFISTLGISGPVLHGVNPSGGTECHVTPNTTSAGYDFADDTSCDLSGVHDTITTVDPLLGRSRPTAARRSPSCQPPQARSSTSSPRPTPLFAAAPTNAV